MFVADIYNPYEMPRVRWIVICSQDKYNSDLIVHGAKAMRMTSN